MLEQRILGLEVLLVGSDTLFVHKERHRLPRHLRLAAMITDPLRAADLDTQAATQWRRLPHHLRCSHVGAGAGSLRLWG
jgi:hypothetical protein